MRFANETIDKKMISELAECNENFCGTLKTFIADTCAGRVQRSQMAYLILYDIATGKTDNLKLIADCMDETELSGVFERTDDAKTDYELIEDLSILEIISDVCDVIMNKIREHDDNELLVSAVNAVLRLKITAEDMLGIIMTSAVNDNLEIIKCIDNYKDYHFESCDFKNSLLSQNEFYYRIKSYGIVASALAGNADILDYFTHDGADFTADKPFVIKQITEIISYLNTYYNCFGHKREHYGISYFGNEELLSDLDYNCDSTYEALEETELCSAMAVTAIKNISNYYSIGTTHFIKFNTDIFDETYNPLSETSAGGCSYREDLLKAELLCVNNINIVDLSSLLRLRNPYKYINAYAKAASNFGTIIIPQYMLYPTLVDNNCEYSNGFGKTNEIITFLRLLADITPVKLQVIFDTEPTPETLKKAEMLSGYFIVHFSGKPIADDGNVNEQMTDMEVNI